MWCYVAVLCGAKWLGLIFDVLCLNGEGCNLELTGSTMGRDVYLMVSRKLPPKKGGRLTLHTDSRLMPHKTLQEQGIEGKTATLSCTYVPTNLCTAWKYLQGFPVSEPHLALDGVTQIGYWWDPCDQGLVAEVTLPSSLQSLTFGHKCEQSLDGVTLPSNLQSLTFGRDFKQSLDGVNLPSNLQSLAFVCRSIRVSVS